MTAQPPDPRQGVVPQQPGPPAPFQQQAGAQQQAAQQQAAQHPQQLPQQAPPPQYGHAWPVVRPAPAQPGSWPTYPPGAGTAGQPVHPPQQGYPAAPGPPPYGYNPQAAQHHQAAQAAQAAQHHQAAQAAQHHQAAEGAQAAEAAHGYYAQPGYPHQPGNPQQTGQPSPQGYSQAAHPYTTAPAGAPAQAPVWPPTGHAPSWPPTGHAPSWPPTGHAPSWPPTGHAPYGQAPYGQAPYGQAPYGQAPYGQAQTGYPPRAFTTHVFPAAHAAAGHPKVRLGHAKLIVPLVSIIAAAVVVLIAASAVSPTPTPPGCQLQLCAQPATGPPVEIGTLYTSSTFGFSVRYEDATAVNAAAGEVQLGYDFKGNEGNDTLEITGQQAGGDDAQQVVQSVESSQFPNAVSAYTVPGALVGYAPGYGVAFDVFSNDPDGSQSDQRVILMAAVQGGLAVIVLAYGPKFVLTEQNGLVSHPSGADLPVAVIADPIINSITWPS